MTACTAAGSTGPQSPTADPTPERASWAGTEWAGTEWAGTEWSGTEWADSTSDRREPARSRTTSARCGSHQPPGRARCPPRR